MEDDDFEKEIVDSDYEIDYETDTDEKFVHNYLKANNSYKYFTKLLTGN